MVRVTPVNDAKRRPDQLAQKGLLGLRDNAPHVGMIGQSFDTRDYFTDQAFAYVGYALFGVPDPNRFEISY